MATEPTPFGAALAETVAHVRTGGELRCRLAAVRMLETAGMNAAAKMIGRMDIETWLTPDERESKADRALRETGDPQLKGEFSVLDEDPNLLSRLILRNQLAIMAAEQSHHLPCEAVWRYLEAAMTETDVVLGERPLVDHEDEDASDDVS